MKNIILALVFILPFVSFSQSHYIIPDIGAPDMAVYVEMIAPHNQKGYFGDDGLYLPGVDTEVQINAVQNSQYVTFGPMVVSWDGRLISTHIFIDRSANPTLTTADPSYEVIIEITGTTVPATRTFNYFIVKPQSLGVNGDISGVNETVLGDGNLGFRSPRGAMILDSLTLKPGTNYSVSVKDPDGNIANGNQGFFPAIILSKGPINGNGSTISVSAQSKMAGPGGGGGGGRFDDFGLFDNSRGTDGGAGYTGGGKGGYNASSVPGQTDEYRDIGTGTGGRGISYNGVAIDDPTGGYEASYGGTGHPFGTVGKQSTSGNAADWQGGYGGGTGYRNSTQGGAGGFATVGGGANVTGGTTGGKIHGNIMSIPLAGGSGGAGGNPQGLSAESGEGGGGGGAIKLFGSEVRNIKIDANGHNGTDGDGSADGGPGSGGAISLMGKVGISGFDLTASGGSRSGRTGGSGRIRFDGFNGNTDPSFTPSDVSKYRGISTDTSNYIKPRHRLFGTHKPNGQVKLYQKSKTTDWTMIADFPSLSLGWVSPLNYDVNHEDEYYIVAVQEETRIVDDYTYQPGFVLSQAATNILRFGEPEIYCPKDTSFDLINCANVVYEDSIQIQSIGGDFLNIIVEDKWVFGDRGFEILNLGDYDISPQSPDSLFYINFRYTKLAGQSGIITDTLILYNNSPTKDSCRIAVSINLQDAKITFRNQANNTEIDTLDLGTICVGDIATGKFNIRNDSDFDLTNLRLVKSGNGQEIDFTLSPTTIPVIGFSLNSLIDVSFQDLGNNAFVNGVSIEVVVYSDECPDPIDSLVIFIKVVTSELTLSEADRSLDFGSVPVGQTKDMTVTMTNTGDRPALITNPLPVNNPFSFVSSSEALPFTLNPIKLDATAKIDFTYRLSPTASGDFIDSTLFESLEDIPTGSCNYDIEMYLTGTSTVAEISFIDTLDFGLMYECQDSTADRFITNESEFTIAIDTANARFSGGDLAFFKFLAKPRTINVQNQFRIKYEPPVKPTTAGIKQSKIEFELDPTTGETFEIVVKAEVDTFLVDYLPGKPIDYDLGDIPVGFDVAPQKLRITNNGKLPRTVTGVTFPPSSKLTVNHTLGLPITIAPGGFEEFDVDIDLMVGDEGPFREDIIFNFVQCNNELPVTVIANGVKGELEIVTDLNLGDLPPCFDLSIPVLFRNKGDADISLDSVIIEENGVEIYRLLNMPQTLTVLPGANAYQEDIKIKKSGLKVGSVYNATLKAYTTENKLFQEYPPKAITANIKSGLIITPQPVDFGGVGSGQSKTISVTIEKDPAVQFSDTASFRADIIRSNMKKGFNEYQFNSPDSLFLIGGDNQPKSFDIVFNPTINQNYDDTLDVKVSINGCEFFMPLAIKGTALAGDTLLIYTKDMIGVEPDIDNYRIPIYGKLKSADIGIDKTASIEISNLDIDFNKTIFFPMTITNGTFTKRETDGASTLLSISMDNPVTVNSTDEVILTELVGPTMLGNVKDNLFHLNATPSITDSTGISTIIATSSFFNLTVCSEGGDRLLEYTDGFNFTLIKSFESFVIDAHLVEPGLHRVRIMNMTGKTELIEEIVRLNSDKNDYSIEYDTSNLSSGVYYVLFETPARYKTHKLIIIK